MKIKSITAILLSVLFVLTLCFESPEIRADAESNQDNSQTDTTGGSLSKYLGVWYDKASVDSGQILNGNPNVKVVVTGITKDKLLFSICQSYASLESAIATRQADGSYLFTFNEVKSDFFTSCSYGSDFTGKFTFNEMKLTAEIGGSKTEGIGFTGELVYYSALYKGSKCNLIDYMTDYKTAYQKVAGNPSLNLSLVEDKYSGLVSEVSVGVGMGFWSEESRYIILLSS